MSSERRVNEALKCSRGVLWWRNETYQLILLTTHRKLLSVTNGDLVAVFFLFCFFMVAILKREDYSNTRQSVAQLPKRKWNFSFKWNILKGFSSMLVL